MDANGIPKRLNALHVDGMRGLRAQASDSPGPRGTLRLIKPFSGTTISSGLSSATEPLMLRMLRMRRKQVTDLSSTFLRDPMMFDCEAPLAMPILASYRRGVFFLGVPVSSTTCEQTPASYLCEVKSIAPTKLSIPPESMQTQSASLFCGLFASGGFISP